MNCAHSTIVEAALARGGKVHWCENCGSRRVLPDGKWEYPRMFQATLFVAPTLEIPPEYQRGYVAGLKRGIKMVEESIAIITESVEKEL